MRRFDRVVWLMAVVLLTGCAAEISQENMARFAMESPQGGGREAPEARATAVPALAADQAPVVTASVAPDAAVRSIIYNGGLRLVVPDIAAAEQAIQQQARAAQGYLQELDGNAITIRVPAAKFDATLAALERLGEVTGRHIKANDVTETMRDLKIRLENAVEVRKRLTDLIAKADKIEDTIKLEQELERVTETIELLKGKLQYMQDQVAFSTIRVDLNSPRPQSPGGLAVPFAWVKELADGAVTGVSEPMPDTNRFWSRNERFALPSGFVRYFERDHVTEAMSADDVLIKLRRQDNYDGGDLGFWSKLARRAIVENRAIAVISESDVKVKDGTAGHLVVGVKDQGAHKQGYLLGIVSTRRYVYTFESWGDQDKVDKARSALEAAFGSLDVNHW